jgi:pimeloyl-ACP methyl ester carboxylesterase
MEAYLEFIPKALSGLGVGEYSLVAHDWGGLGLFAALAEPERVRRAVAISITPPVPGFRWHRTARIWRTRGAGELLNALWSRPMVALSLRESRGDWSAMPTEFVDMVRDGVDRGTLDTILRLYRSGDEEKLVAAARGIDTLTAPALVLWGMKDRYVSGRLAAPIAAALPNADLIELPDAGHWPWTEQPEVVDTVLEFLEA